MLNVAVTGLNAADTPAPGVPIIQCLKETSDFKGTVIGLAYDPLESGILDRTLLCSAYLLPYPSLGQQPLLTRIRSIHKRERIDLIIPTLDTEILNFIQIQEELLRLKIHLFLPTEEAYHRRSKINLPKFAETFGFKTPKTVQVTNLNKIDLTEKELPIIVKGIFYEAYLAHSLEDVYRFVRKIAARWGYPVLLQEYIEGEEFNAVAVGDQNSAVGTVCMKKLVRTDQGKGWACVSIRNGDLIDITQRVVASLNWRGPIEVEAILSKKDHQFYLIELNPRFPAWVYLAKAAGINLPPLVLKMAMGQAWEAPKEYQTGVVFSHYTTHLITDLPRIQTLFTTGEIHYEETV